MTDRDTLHEALRSVLLEHPVRLAILFGSHASGDSHVESDVDVAVELDGLRPGQDGYNETFFRLSADVSEALGRDDVDVVDVHSLTPSLARSVAEHGVVLVGDRGRADRLLGRTATDDADQSPRERLAESLRRIDEHLA